VQANPGAWFGKEKPDYVHGPHGKKNARASRRPGPTQIVGMLGDSVVWGIGVNGKGGIPANKEATKRKKGRR